MPTKHSDKSNQSEKFAKLIGQLALSKKAEHVLAINVQELTSLTDFFVICSADTEIQVKAIADAIRKGTPMKPWHREGYEFQHWILLDYIDVVVHVFKTSERNYYNLEKLWSDAPIIKFTDESETISDAGIN